MAGWIKLHRSLKLSEISGHPEYLAVWVHLLLRAQHAPSSCVIGRSIVRLEKGQLVFGRAKFSLQIGVSESKVRAALDVLKSLDMITIKSMAKFSIISIAKWSEYQDESPANNHEIASNAPATHQQIATCKNDKNDKNDKNKDLLGDEKPKKSKAVKTDLDYSVWPQEPDQQLLADWKKVRSANKAPITQTVLKSFGDEFRKAATFGYTVDDCLRCAITTGKGWTGFKFEWMQNQLSKVNRNAGYQSDNRAIGNASSLAHDDTKWADELFGTEPPAVDRFDQQGIQVIEGNFSRLGGSD